MRPAGWRAVHCPARALLRPRQQGQLESGRGRVHATQAGAWGTCAFHVLSASSAARTASAYRAPERMGLVSSRSAAMSYATGTSCHTSEPSSHPQTEAWPNRPAPHPARGQHSVHTLWSCTPEDCPGWLPGRAQRCVAQYTFMWRRRAATGRVPQKWSCARAPSPALGLNASTAERRKRLWSKPSRPGWVSAICTPASEAKVGSRSRARTGASETTSAGTLPGQRAMAGTRRPPSHTCPRPPLSPPARPDASQPASRCGPVREAKKTSVRSVAPRRSISSRSSPRAQSISRSAWPKRPLLERKGPGGPGPKRGAE
mmetsp:Transcript_22213/g.69330  ORF Transcript_22213/g.69330 Transcript_22213/m.69330 type:complete len:315 (-) Transcript_22213:857-1801(-)